MRRAYIGLLFFVCAVVSWAQPFDPFAPENPIVMGRGGSFTATASGYNSFFYNPAGFARGGELTLTSANLWAFMDRDLVNLVRDAASGSLGFTGSASRAFDPADFESIQTEFEEIQTWAEGLPPGDLEAIVQTAAGDSGITLDADADLADVLAAANPEDVTAFLDAFEDAAEASGTGYPSGSMDVILATLESGLPSGYLRAGGQVGLGYVGNGLGLGLFANVEATVDGSNILEAYGTAYNTITFVGGLGLSFGNLHVGVSIRPTVFGYTRINASPLVAAYLSGQTLDYTTAFTNTVYYGSGLGVDVGALWELGPFSVGLAAKDLLGTQILYRKSDFDTYYQALLQASLPAGAELTESERDNAWTIPMKLNAGFEFHPDMGVLTYLIDPSVSVDLLDMTSAIRTWQAGEQVTPDQIVSMLNFGGELKLLRFLAIRGGYYGGYLSAGLGLDIFLLDINAAVAGDFGRTSDGSWAFSNVGGSLEVGIRF